MADRYTGILCIGDPHLASRAPGFRKDDYPGSILSKLAWSLDYAAQNNLLPVILGDLFHLPRDNANWLLVKLLDLFHQPILAIAGNHDCNENTLTDHDTLSILSASGRLRLLDTLGPWIGTLNGIPAAVGGTCWGQPLPEKLDRSAMTPAPSLVFWVAHHDIRFPGNEETGRYRCQEIPGVDVLINGHIHRALEDAVCGMTTWINPGNISRVSRSDGNRQRRPEVLRLDVTCEGDDANPRWARRIIEVPHQPFDDVFHPEIESVAVPTAGSLFIHGLAQLESLRTAGGAGLAAFLDANLNQFHEPVAAEIRQLAKEVLNDGEHDT